MITKEQYKEAIKQLKEESREKRAIEAIYSLPGHCSTARQMANLAGFTNYQESNLSFGLAGKAVSIYLGIKPPLYSEGEPNWWSTIASGDKSGPEFKWVLRPEVVNAIKDIAEVGFTDSLVHHADDILEDTSFHEGAASIIRVSIYERSRIARQRCIQYYGSICIICGFDFESTYGEIGKDYIHIHHIVPVSEVGENYVVDPINDLRPVCPNCHAMLHRKKPPLSIEDLKKVIRLNQPVQVTARAGRA